LTERRQRGSSWTIAILIHEGHFSSALAANRSYMMRCLADTWTITGDMPESHTIAYTKTTQEGSTCPIIRCLKTTVISSNISEVSDKKVSPQCFCYVPFRCPVKIIGYSILKSKEHLQKLCFSELLRTPRSFIFILPFM
jgi:hypothetical protein